MDNMHIFIDQTIMSRCSYLRDVYFLPFPSPRFPSTPHPAFPTWVPEPENLLEVEAATERACQDSTYDETSPPPSLLPGLLIAHVCD